MSIVVSCDCGKQFKVKDEYAGKKGKCTGCGKGFVVPGGVKKAAPAVTAASGKPPAMKPAPVKVKAPPPPPPAAEPAFPDWDALQELETTGEVQADEPVTAASARLPLEEKAAPPRVPQQKACPFCGSMISSFAIICPDCGTNLKLGGKAPKAGSSKSRGGGGGGGVDFSEMSGLDWVIALLCPGIGVIVGIIRIIRGRPSGAPLLIISVIVNLVGGAIKIALMNAHS
jgi:hypothetical protein